MTWTLARLRPGERFPPPEQALPSDAPYPGLLAVGGRVDAHTLQSAYAQGIFPWFGADEPPLWWTPDPRMVLVPAELKVHRSLRQSARRRIHDPRYALRVDSDFRAVMRACAAPRRDTDETWIVPSIIDAYDALHAKGLAHSFELWEDETLVAGLYCVALGGMVFGESMFTRVDDGSKLLLMALCGFCLRHGIGPIDCQQQTAHLARLGARAWPRAAFMMTLAQSSSICGPSTWQYDLSQFQRDCAHWL